MDLDAVWSGEWGQSRMVVLDGVKIVEAVGSVLGINVGHPIVTNGVIILCRERWRRGSSQITLGFLVNGSFRHGEGHGQKYADRRKTV